MKPSSRPFIASGVAIIALAAAACSAPAPNTTSGTGGYYPAAPTASAAAQDPAAPVVAVSDAALGPGTALVDGTGRAVYLFENDTTPASTCGATCASVWPPVPAAAGVAPDGQLGSTRRIDGTTQLTYDGHPLYYYIGDHKPGDSHGQGLNQFGAHWYLLQPSGAELGKD